MHRLTFLNRSSILERRVFFSGERNSRSTCSSLPSGRFNLFCKSNNNFQKLFSTNNNTEKFSAVSNSGIGLKIRLDYKTMCENIEELKKSLNLRKMTGSPDSLSHLYTQHRALITEMNGLRAKHKNESNKTNREEGKHLKIKLKYLQNKLDEIDEELVKIAIHLPNFIDPNVPPTEAKVLRLIGEKPKFNFHIKSFDQIAEDLQLVDFEGAAMASGSRFYYLKNELALLELALIQWSMQKLVSKGWTPILAPDLVRSDIAKGCGFHPRGPAPQTYSIEGHDLCLVGTAEIPLAGMYTSRIIPVDKLPIKLVGFSHAFRTEVNELRTTAKSLYRVHQFSKVEMFSFTSPLMSESIHLEMLAIQEELFSELGLHYKVLEMPADDLGAPAIRKFDIECWFPSRVNYGEISSTSNCTDYQSRRLNIRFKSGKENQFPHTVNGTACAVPRLLMAILESNQQKDGTVVIPKCLVPFMGGITHISWKS